MSEKIIEWNKILEFFGLENENPPNNKQISKKNDKVVSKINIIYTKSE